MEAPSDAEVHRPANASGYPHISFGLPFDQACAKHAEHTFKAKRSYIIAYGSLSRNTKTVERLQNALGDKVVGVRRGMTPHTLWSEILEVTKAAVDADADLLVTLGAGSLTDGAKIIATVGDIDLCSTRQQRLGRIIVTLQLEILEFGI